MKLRGAIALALIAVTMLVAGCVKANMKTTVNRDGSGDVAITLSMPSDQYDQVRQLGGDPFQKSKADFKSAGYRVADSTDGTNSVGFVASKHFPDVTGQTVPKAITQAMRIAENTTTVAASSASGSISKRLGLSQDTWVTALMVPGGTGRGADYTIELVMPGKVVQSNAQSRTDGGRTLVWKLEPDKKNAVNATSLVDQTPRLLAMIVAAVVGLAIATFTVLYSRRRREGPSSQTAAAPPTEPEPATPEDQEA